MKTKTYWFRIETGIQSFCRYEVKALSEEQAKVKAVRQHMKINSIKDEFEYNMSCAYYEGDENPDVVRARMRKIAEAKDTGFNYKITLE